MMVKRCQDLKKFCSACSDVRQVIRLAKNNCFQSKAEEAQKAKFAVKLCGTVFEHSAVWPKRG